MIKYAPCIPARGTEVQIKGDKIYLKPARLSERRKIYYWLCFSDISRFIIGPLKFPEPEYISLSRN
ncbi:MAG TPA: hypothetical protein VJC03_08520 [bacterium]|nr:hypothetical protein [bacterium]